MIARRTFVAGLGATATWPVAARAQSFKMHRIGFVGLANPSPAHVARLAGLISGLRDLGYEDGRNMTLEVKWADNHYSRLPELFAEMVRIKVDVIVTHGTPGVIAAKKATSTIPIIFAVAGDALASGLIASLARPGGNVTGLTYFNPELAAKRLELLKEILPHLREVGVLMNPANPMNEPIMPAMRNTGEPLNLRLHQIAARVDDAKFDSVFTEMGTKRVEAFVVLDDPMLIAMAPVVAKRALAERLPSCGWPEFAESGGLIAYGIDFVTLYRHAATLVHKVLNGTTPAELPVERATRFFMVVNRQTANTLGLHVPDVLLTRADQVIE